MKLYMRLVILTLSSCGVLMIVSVFIGHQLQTTVVTGYIKDEVSVYTEYVEDVTHNFRLILAGTRCFDSFPREYYLALYDAGFISMNMAAESFVSRYANAADAITALLC